MLEGQVDRDAEEGRREDDGDDLGLEGVLVPGVVGEGDARGVACVCCVLVLIVLSSHRRPLSPSLAQQHHHIKKQT